MLSRLLISLTLLGACVNGQPEKGNKKPDGTNTAYDTTTSSSTEACEYDWLESYSDINLLSFSEITAFDSDVEEVELTVKIT